MIFAPPNSTYRDAPDIIKIKKPDGAMISAIYLPNKKAKYTLLVSHGNADDLGRNMPLFIAMQKHGYAVFSYDYEGYGTSKGWPSENKSYADIDAAYNYLTSNLRLQPKQIIVYGHSLGAAITLDLAIRKEVAGVILVSPFVTAFRVMTQIPLVPFDKFDNLTKIKKLKYPLLIIHGTKDAVVPFWQGKMLYENANAPKQNFWVDGAGHNDILQVAKNNFWLELEKFVNSI
jgi:abhydrolase domain-containing protein 17